MQRGNTPYQQLGKRLGAIRRRLQETIAEVSGAVELDNEQLDRIERGEVRPSEDILLLLINHFAISDDEADELWDLAGYQQDKARSSDDPSATPTIVMLPFDNRIVYTDTAHVSINSYGVVMDFMQNGLHNQPVAIARIGMSIDHAKQVLEVLAKTIAKAEAPRVPRQLPSGRPASRRKKQD